MRNEMSQIGWAADTRPATLQLLMEERSFDSLCSPASEKVLKLSCEIRLPMLKISMSGMSVDNGLATGQVKGKGLVWSESKPQGSGD